MRSRTFPILLACVLFAISVVTCAKEPTSTTPTPPDNELVLSIPFGTDNVLRRGGLRDPETVWIELFRNARTSIDLAQFYATSFPGSALERVIDALEEAKQRGVVIRFLADQNMINTTANDDYGGTGRLRCMLNMVDETGRKTENLRMFTAAAQTTGGIHHAKYFIVDGEVAYVGSQNFDWRALEYIHEIGVRTTDSTIVHALAAIFAHDWQTTENDAQTWWTPEPIDVNVEASDGRTTIVASPPLATPPGIDGAEEELLRMIANARTSIAIEVKSYRASWPEGSPHTQISDALRDAAQRGVDVRLLVDQSNIGAFADLHALTDGGVTVRMVTIPALWPIKYAWLIHAKAIIIDNEVLWVGTSNWSPDYFNASRNIELIFEDAGLAAQGLMLYDDLWNSPYVVDLAKIPLPTK